MIARIVGLIMALLALVGGGLASYSVLHQEPNSPQANTSTITVEKGPEAASLPVAKTPTSQTDAPVAQEPTVIAPGPLRAPTTTTVTQTSSGALTVSGVIMYTNLARAQNGSLPPLAENRTLDQDAALKLADMFAKQYFEHISPTGVGPADLAKTVGYAYILVGENLALGDFGGDAKLVDAWMNSPGHRANILNTHYQEIGVAVGKGMYEGKMTWLAVQSFGMPLSACPSLDQSMKAQIDANNTQITQLKAELDAKKAQIDATSPRDPNYNTYVDQYNALVTPYNTLVQQEKILVDTYNAEVRAYNDCLNAAGAGTATTTITE